MTLRLTLLVALGGAVLPVASGQSVAIQVDTGKPLGPLKPVWSFLGYDEPNYTYMKDGRKLLAEFADASSVPVYVRTHSLLVTGDGIAALKWGSTNAYTEDANGKPVYDWTIVDRIFDTYLQRGMKPLVQIGFMPQALSTKPEPYRHHWKPGDNYNDIYLGWAYPPKDYAKWAELVYQWVRHCVQKYGKAEVDSWLWEVWNEPNIPYWKGTPEEYHKLYDYSADAVKRALPSARIGGADSTGPGNAKAAEWMRNFLAHVVRGKNYVTGKVGSPIDFVSFHAKGSPKFVEGGVVMGIENQLRDLDKGFEIVASFPELKGKPIVIGESDPEGCAACSSRVYANNSYRNGVMYSSYTATVMPRHLELAAKHGVNLLGAVTWAFEFEDQPYFDGFRDLATNGIDKPVLNVFRMLGMMTGQRVAVSNPAAESLEAMLAGGVKGNADVHAFASRGTNSVTVMVSNYHDSEKPGPPAQVDVRIAGLPGGRIQMQHYRVDGEFSNAFEAWKKMGSPQQPTPQQYTQLERAGQLQLLESPKWVQVQAGQTRLEFALPLHGVSLIRLTW
ncbi:beta-xylosidase [uncultured Paludibaculum sp.]|uniref:GH39 family glycosyl hydrolase n=1 Tax=uncultured Paludibaculum sp. TaxID=1765020 RepID=UPI002AAB2569|nr:beta-xylosidase [uncultured Paludibaculum sp.]